jgi:hypothetical protein
MIKKQVGQNTKDLLEITKNAIPAGKVAAVATNKIFSVPEASRITGISESTLYRYKSCLWDKVSGKLREVKEVRKFFIFGVLFSSIFCCCGCANPDHWYPLY